jgi:hypothetical protein
MLALPEEYEHLEDRRSSGLGFLGVMAIICGLFPIAVVSLGLLPTYYMHSRFLLFYAPVVALLLLGYLLYIRELIGRLLFGDVLDAAAAAESGYVDVAWQHNQERLRRFRAGILYVVPLLLVGLSFYCLKQYVVRLNDSVAVSSQLLLGRLPIPPATEAVTDSAPPGRRRAREATDTVTASQPIPTSDQQPDVERRMAVLKTLPGLAHDPNPLRTYTLRTATIDDIPYFMELTALYIGGIVGPLVAVFMILLKEHARRELGLSEREVLSGRREDLLIRAAEGATSPERS